jgi:NAD(P) transhydrogenase
VLAQFAAVATVGGTVGTIIGRRITATELPQMVAALHSVVGLAAVLTSIGSVIGAAADHISTLHLVTAYLGVLIGAAHHSSLTSPVPGLSADIVTGKVA